MPAVFVHGVPETEAVWDALIHSLDANGAVSRSDAVALRLPGFGSALPDAFDATMATYAEWLAAELAAIEGPIDLVSHDWGALLSMKVLAGQPSNVRSWVTDMGDLQPDFEWHDTARTWQTPGDGEAFMEVFLAVTDAERAELMVGLGVAEPAASTLAKSIDATMGDAILRLYRSAVAIGAEWGPGIDSIAVPAMVVEATDDTFRAEGACGRLAERLGGQLTVLDGHGHWWMVSDPDRAASAIANFWSSL